MGGRRVRKRVWMMVRFKVWGCLTARVKGALWGAAALKAHEYFALVVINCWKGFGCRGGHGEMVRQAKKVRGSRAF